MHIEALYTLFQQHPAISTDSRMVAPGSIFFALKGAQFDGNRFALKALDQGAAFAIVSDPSITSEKVICVEDTLETLQALARHHRRQFKGPVLAITGSNGKTTTKELITAVLSSKFVVHATKGNLNNHIGVPLTLLGIRKDTAFVVCEMGANHPGEIALLCRIAEPAYGLITNIGKAHLEGFGSLEGVKKAKGELFDHLRENKGLAFINTDDPRLNDLGMLISRKVSYGFNPEQQPDILFDYVSHPGTTGFTLQDSKTNLSIQSQMFGFYNAINMLAAYAVGHYFEIPDEQIAKTLSSFVPGANRSETIQFKDCTIIKDAYNANPSSMELAIRAFHERYPKGWIILGDMKELGNETGPAHLQIIELIRGLSFEKMYLVGSAFQEALVKSGLSDDNVIVASSIEKLKSDWDWVQPKGKTILLKGSRSMQLEKLLDAS